MGPMKWHPIGVSGNHYGQGQWGTEEEDPRGEGLLSLDLGELPFSGLSLQAALSMPGAPDSCWERNTQIQKGGSVNKSLHTTKQGTGAE